MNKLVIATVIAAATLAGCAKKGMTPAVRSDISAKLASTQEPMHKC